MEHFHWTKWNGVYILNVQKNGWTVRCKKNIKKIKRNVVSVLSMSLDFAWRKNKNKGCTGIQIDISWVLLAPNKSGLKLLCYLVIMCIKLCKLSCFTVQCVHHEALYSTVWITQCKSRIICSENEYVLLFVHNVIYLLCRSTFCTLCNADGCKCNISHPIAYQFTSTNNSCNTYYIWQMVTT